MGPLPSGVLKLFLSGNVKEKCSSRKPFSCMALRGSVSKEQAMN